jgi:hypothetical protein
MACIQDLIFIVPVLAEHWNGRFPDRLGPFFRGMLAGHFDDVVAGTHLWEDLNSRASATAAVHHLAAGLFASLPKRRRREEGEQLSTATVDALRGWALSVPESALPRATRIAGQLELLLSKRKRRLLSAADVHSVALFSERPFKAAIPPDQAATIASVVVEREPGRWPDRGEWQQLRAFASHAIDPGMTWSYSAPTSLGTRMFGYSLQGSLRWRQSAPADGVLVKSEFDAAVLRISIERENVQLVATAYMAPGIVRGIAVPRSLTSPFDTEEEIRLAVSFMMDNVLAAVEH